MLYYSLQPRWNPKKMGVDEVWNVVVYSFILNVGRLTTYGWTKTGCLWIFIDQRNRGEENEVVIGRQKGGFLRLKIKPWTRRTLI